MDSVNAVLTGDQLADIHKHLELTRETWMIESLSMHVNGSSFDEAPTDWQRMVEDMVKRGVKFNIGETK